MGGMSKIDSEDLSLGERVEKERASLKWVRMVKSALNLDMLILRQFFFNVIPFFFFIHLRVTSGNILSKIHNIPEI